MYLEFSGVHIKYQIWEGFKMSDIRLHATEPSNITMLSITIIDYYRIYSHIWNDSTDSLSYNIKNYIIKLI
jgi:hypothetical protein